MKKKTLLFGILVLGAMQGNAQTQKQKNSLVSNTTISVFSNQNFGSYIFNEREGQISTKNHASNFGLSISKDFYVLPKEMFLSAGLKLYETSSVIDVKNSLKGLDPNSGWRYTINYSHFVVPIYVGKTFHLFEGSKAHITTFGGISAGISKQTGFQLYGSSGATSDTITSVSMYSKAPNGGKIGFYSSVDAGFRITPFNFPNLTVGATASFDITKSQSFGTNGSIVNEISHVSEAYSFDFTRRFVNVMLQVNYTFGRKWKNSL